MINGREIFDNYNKIVELYNKFNELKKENEQLTMRILKMRMIFNSTYGAGGNISKKKPILDVGTKIKFSDGSIATIVYLRKEIILFFESHKEKLDYLIGKTWEIIE